MAQQFQQYPQQEQLSQPGYQPQYQAQTPVGQQLQTTQFGQMTGQRFSESVPNEVQRVVADLDRLSTVAEWGKVRATQRGMHRLARVCDDLADIAHLEKKLIIKQSPFAQPIGHATRQVIQNSVQELQQYMGQPEVQETLSEAQQTANGIQNALHRLQTFGTGLQQTGQSGQMGQFGQPGQYGQIGQPGRMGQYGQIGQHGQMGP